MTSWKDYPNWKVKMPGIMRVKLKEKIGKFIWDYFGFPKAGLIAQESLKEIRRISEKLTKGE